MTLKKVKKKTANQNKENNLPIKESKKDSLKNPVNWSTTGETSTTTAIMMTKEFIIE